MSTDPPDIMFVEFFGKKYLSATNKLPALLVADKTLDEELKINELGIDVCISYQVSAVATTLWLQCDQTLPLCEGSGLRD